MNKKWIIIFILLAFQNILFAQNIAIPHREDCDYITVIDGPWIFTFNENGSVDAQYGAGPMEESIDF